MARGPKSTFDGLDETTRRTVNARRKLHGVTVALGAKRTTGRVWRKREQAWETLPPRSAGDNVIIVRTHAKTHTAAGPKLPTRNIAFLDAKERRHILLEMKVAIDSITSGAIAVSDPILAKGRKIGEYMIGQWSKHIEAGKGRRGRLKPVAESTRKAKERETQKTNLPPLERTGQLKRSFKVESVRRTGR